MSRLDGRVVVVTGAGRGLGRAYALALAAEGAAVVVNDAGGDVGGAGADPGAAAGVAAEIVAAGGRAVADDTRIGTFAAGDAVVRAARAAFGRIDVLVNNAGIVRSHPTEAFPPDDWDAVVAVHLTGTFACARAAFAAFRAAGRGGRIVNVTSGAGIDGAYPGTAAYSAAKAGVVALTRVLAAEGAPHAIAVNAIAPLATTRMSAGFLAGAPPDPRLDPAVVAPLVVYLASSLADGVSGQVFRCRAGRVTMLRPADETAIAYAPLTPERLAAGIAALAR